jgi:aminoglycoside 6'-N-acetyltransferase
VREVAGPEHADALPGHDVRLTDGDLVLRPMREDDLPQALEWDNDPEVHYYMQGETQPVFTLEDLGDMYRGVARAAHVFVIEVAGRDIGTCWLQDMNVERLIRRFPGRSLKRIDLSIGVKDLWGRGIGTRVIRLLTRFGLDRLGADAIFAVGIYDFNARSLGAFQNAGFRLFEVVPAASPGRGGTVDHILVIEGESFTAR